jgi:hypothetical protein
MSYRNQAVTAIIPIASGGMPEVRDLAAAPAAALTAAAARGASTPTAALRSTPAGFTTAATTRATVHGGSQPVATGMFAAIQRGVGDLQNPVGEAAFTGGYAIEPT